MTRRRQTYEGKTTPVHVWNQPGNWKDFPPTFTWEQRVNYTSGDLVESQGHDYRSLGKPGTGDIGGNFQVFGKNYEEWSGFSLEPAHYSIHNPWGDPMANGVTHHYFVPRAVSENVTDLSWPFIENQVIPTGGLELDALGTTAISRVLPTNAEFSAAQFLGELREGMPRFGFDTWRERANRARSAGSDYLNVEFGWKPLVSDIQGFCDAVRNADRILKQYERDSGKLLHRRYKFPEEEETTIEVSDGHRPSPILDHDLFHPATYGRLEIIKTRKVKRWFSGAFTYYLPPQGSMDRAVAEANRLYGVRFTPETLWELSPWSWAVDWFSNIGDVIHNVAAFQSDGLVMPYAYIMEEKSIRAEYRLSGIAYRSYPYLRSLSQTFETNVKTRRKATPYGFGFDMSTLTGRQIAILIGLGLSRT